MKKIVAFGLLLVASMPAFALEKGQVKYVGGTVHSLTVDTVGGLDIASDTSLTFESPGSKLVVPYAAIESIQYSKEVARHLGVLPAIAIGLIKQRQHRHFFRITYHDQNHMEQLAVFEVAKQMSSTLQAVLDTRVPQVRKSDARCGCGN